MALYDSRVCRACGRPFRGGPRAWYCPECRAERKKQQHKEFRQRKAAGHTRKIGIDESVCENCGKMYTVQSGNQKYCPDCAPIMVAKIDRQQGMDYYITHRDTVNPSRNDKRRKRVAVCAVCGKEYPACGKRSSTCSDACRAIRRKQHWKTADAKRTPRKNKTVTNNAPHQNACPAKGTEKGRHEKDHQ